MRKDLQSLVTTINVAFDRLRDRCPHRLDDENTCMHPDVEDERSMCTPGNCPLLDA